LFFEQQPDIITLSKIGANITAGRELLKYVEEERIGIRKVNDLKKDISIGGAVADDSSEPLRSYASLRYGGFIRVSARIRIGCIMTFNIELSDGFPKVIVPDFSRTPPKFLPEHIAQGGSAEFLYERFRRPYLQSPIVTKGLDYEIAWEFTKKLNDYDLVEFNLNIIEQAVSEAKHKASSCDVAIALVDGSIIPGHLDPYIYSGSNILNKWPSDMARFILERKERILFEFLNIYESIHRSDNMVLVGAIKRSNDRSLQAMADVYYDASDQILLASAGLEGKILGPFRKHRTMKILLDELEKFSLRRCKEIFIDSYYIMKKRDSLPLQVDVVFPKYMDDVERHFILDLIYHLTEISGKHTQIERVLSGGDLEISTLRPILIVDEEAEKKLKQVKEVVEKDLSAKLYGILKELESISSIDFALFTYVPKSGMLWRVK
jgi:hypothetical protein